MKLATVMYRNPLSEWFWESGVAYWVYGAVAIFLLLIGIILAIDAWRSRK